MSAISQIANKVMGSARRSGSGGRRKPGPVSGGTPTGGSSKDAAIGRKVRGMLGKARR